MNMQEFWENLAKTDSWAAHYGNKINLHTYNFITRRNGVLSLLREDEKYSRILDIGCGTGDYGLLGPRQKGVFYGVDYSWAMIAQARERNGKQSQNHSFLVGSGEHLPYSDNSFDLVLGIGFIEYFPRPEIPIREIIRVLKPNGTLILQSFKWELFGNIRRFITEPARSLFKKRSGDGTGHLPPDWYDQKYSQSQLDSLLGDFGFSRIGYNFNNFLPFHFSMRLKYPKLYIRISEAMYRSSPGFWRFLAANYIGKYRLAKD